MATEVAHQTEDEAQPGSQLESQAREGSEEHSALDTIGGALKQVGQEAILSLLDGALDALFSDDVRARVEHEAAQGLQELLDAVVEAVPETGSGKQFAKELERTSGQLHALLKETLDTLFTGSVRAEFRQHLDEAAQALLQGDVSAAKLHCERALKTFLGTILHVLQSHWAQVLRVLLRVVVKALQEAIASKVEEGLATALSKTKETVEEKPQELQEQVAEKKDELQRGLKEARDKMQQRLEEATSQLRERLGEGVSSAVKDQTGRGSQHGRPPSRRPPSGPPRRHPGEKPVLGRPPSMSR
jgi:uncharacterized membrane-anchored protein YjiN (DUF445 family)